MKILTINSRDISGGAAVASFRLCKGLEKYHPDTKVFFAVGRKDSKDPKVFWTRKNLGEYYAEKMIDTATRLIGLQYVWFPFSSRKLIRIVDTINPDIIYLRNIHGGYFKTELVGHLSRKAPIVWTLSDMWSFTGHCAHAFGDTAWRRLESGCPDRRIYPSIGIDTGRWLIKRKKRIFQNADLTIVTPSKWLYHLARQTPVFKNSKIHQIYNGFDLSLFRQRDKYTCRKALNLPIESKILMFCANDLSQDPWKGGRDLVQILEHIDGRISEKIHLLIVGNGDMRELHQFQNLVIKKTGFVRDEEILATCYSASDIFVYPTKADNLPNVLIEAVSCGTPCVTFDVGGCGEIVENRASGFVVPPGDIEGFAGNVMEILSSEETQTAFSANARRTAEKHFSLDIMCRNYHDLFQKCATSRHDTGSGR
jgi:glycosyltransferase involved in cell wall biosynthesis